MKFLFVQNVCQLSVIADITDLRMSQFSISFQTGITTDYEKQMILWVKNFIYKTITLCFQLKLYILIQGMSDTK